MKKLIQSQAVSTGFALFSMFFGAGNIIFPLIVGQKAADQTFWAILGLLLTAVVVPFAGVLAMVLYDGSYSKFFSRIGKLPGFILTVIILTLLGPIGSIPRCIALSYSTISALIPALSSTGFSAAACLLIYLLSTRKKRLLSILGNYLTPLLLILLLGIILKGLLAPAQTVLGPTMEIHPFWYGLKEGYNTMDLMAAFFFSSTIISILKVKERSFNSQSHGYLKIMIKASLIGGFLLAAVYIGFSYVAAFHASNLPIKSDDQLLSILAIKVAGPYAGYVACATIALACLTTAIALSAVFADFVQKEIFSYKIPYEKVLAATLLVAFFVSTFEFTAISAFLAPILKICYPGLIALTVFNAAFPKKATT